MTKPRIVPVLVTDPDVTYLRVKEDGPYGGHRGRYKDSYDIPVPEDDTLQEDMKLALRAMEMYADFAWSGEQGREADYARARLRARFYLDGDDDD